MCIICTYLTSYLSRLAQGTDLTEIAKSGLKVSEEWAASHLLYCDYSTILTIIGRYIGVISLDTPSTPTFAFPEATCHFFFIFFMDGFGISCQQYYRNSETTQSIITTAKQRNNSPKQPFPPSYGDGCRCPGSWSFDYTRCRRSSSLMCLRFISKFNIDPEK